MTVRDMVHAAQVEIRNSEDLTPGRASELLVMLTALLGNVLDEIRAADAAYAHVLLTFLDEEKKANRARIRSEITPEFARKKEARDTQILVTELIRSLRQMLRTQAEEMRLTR